MNFIGGRAQVTLLARRCIVQQTKVASGPCNRDGFRAVSDWGGNMHEAMNGHTSRVLASPGSKTATGKLHLGATRVVRGHSQPADASTASNETSSSPAPISLDQWRRKTMAMGRVNQRSVAEAITSLQLPVVFSGVRSEIRQALATFKESPDDLCELVYHDPVLATAVFSGFGPTVTSRETKRAQAIRRVTTEHILESLEEAEMDAPTIAPAARPLVTQWWSHATLVSQIASALAGAMDIDRQLARATGFFHDIGRLVLLCTRYGQKLADAYACQPAMTFPTSLAETALLGMNHQEAGALWCRHWKLPSIFEKVCLEHEPASSGGGPLGPCERKLMDIIQAANDIAQGTGNLSDDTLRPLDATMSQIARDHHASLTQALAEAQTMCLWRMGSDGTQAIDASCRLDNALVIHVTGDLSEWNPAGRLMQRAGARVIACTDLRQLMDRCTMGDVMVIDMTTRSLHLLMPMLMRLAHTPCFAQIPKLLLANRDESPESRMKQAGVSMDVLATPIRSASLLQAVRKLMG